MSYFEQEFKDDLDKHIGGKPLITSEDYNRFQSWLHGSSNKKRVINNWMPKLLTTLLLVGACIALFALNPFKSLQDNPPIQELTSDYPTDIKENIDMLPEAIQKKLRVPTRFVSEPENKQLTIMSYPEMNDPKADQIDFIQFDYSSTSPNWRVTIQIWPNGAKESSNSSNETVTLDNGITAQVSENDGFNEISWNANNATYLIQITDVDNSYTVDDTVQLANSMIQ
ncbi:hypothetical protein KO561_17990 [Radiobacillus kanasensis]|uniref:hypothetical protein n=1 Tax=Radiobacillus kanasensis TaxID=2844358 RepID=UPI001E4FE274|nr:hypothetical protein [Radiobacillus kanasensis]UFT99053.1 hypothetical protein KO561_17990 [Radiobacillus kanasensis]